MTVVRHTAMFHSLLTSAIAASAGECLLPRRRTSPVVAARFPSPILMAAISHARSRARRSSFRRRFPAAFVKHGHHSVQREVGVGGHSLPAVQKCASRGEGASPGKREKFPGNFVSWKFRLGNAYLRIKCSIDTKRETQTTRSVQFLWGHSLACVLR